MTPIGRASYRALGCRAVAENLRPDRDTRRQLSQPRAVRWTAWVRTPALMNTHAAGTHHATHSGEGETDVTERFWLWFWHWLARLMPARLVYWAVIRAGAHATTGRYGSTIAPGVTLDRILGRWSRDKLKVGGGEAE